MDIISPENCYVKECMKETRKRKIEVEEDEVRERLLSYLNNLTRLRKLSLVLKQCALYLTLPEIQPPT